MKKYALALLLITIALLPAGLKACDCETPAPPVHFTDGTAPNGPVTAQPGYADPARYGDNFDFRDYGPAAPPVQPYTPPKPNS